MSDRGPDRADPPAPHRTAVLAAAAVAALILGGWWWTSNEPPAGDGRAWEPPSTGPRPLLPAELVAADPAVPAPAAPTVPAEASRADPPVVAPAELIEFDITEIEALLPATDQLIRRQLGLLTANDTIDYSGTVPAGGSYLLDVICVGDGAIEASVTMPDRARSVHTIACDGTLESIELSTASTGHAGILLEARTSSLVTAVTQLVGQ